MACFSCSCFTGSVCSPDSSAGGKAARAWSQSGHENSDMQGGASTLPRDGHAGMAKLLVGPPHVAPQAGSSNPPSPPVMVRVLATLPLAPLPDTAAVLLSSVEGGLGDSVGGGGGDGLGWSAGGGGGVAPGCSGRGGVLLGWSAGGELPLGWSAGGELPLGWSAGGETPVAGTSSEHSDSE